MPMTHWSPLKLKSPKNRAKLTDKQKESPTEQTEEVQTEVLRKLTLMRREVVQLRGDTEELKKIIEDQKDSASSQNNLITSLEHRIKQMDRSGGNGSNWANAKAKLHKLIHINELLSRLMETNYVSM